MSQYIYGGPARYVGRFGPITTGTILDLTDEEAASVASNTWWAPLPERPITNLPKSTAYTLGSTDAGKLLTSLHSSAVVHTLPASPAVGYNVLVECAPTATGNLYLDPNGNRFSGVNDSKRVASVTVTNAGTGYTSKPTIGFTGGSGSGASASVAMKALTVGITDGGTGYEADDVLTLVGGAGTAATVTVSAVDENGAITEVEITTAGAYTTLPTGACTVTGGAGADATITIATYGVDSITVSAKGYGYDSAPTVTFTGGGGASAAATAVLEDCPGRVTVTAADGIVGYYWNGANWIGF